jgi:hypothetical protein
MNEVKKWIIVWLINKPKLALLLLLLPLAGLYSSVVESYPSGIAYQNCSGCHNDGAYPATRLSGLMFRQSLNAIQLLQSLLVSIKLLEIQQFKVAFLRKQT